MANIACRHTSWIHLLAFFSALAAVQRIEEHFPRYWGHTTCMYALLHTHVYLWQEGEDVDGAEEFYGEFLSGVVISNGMLQSCLCIWVAL